MHGLRPWILKMSSCLNEQFKTLAKFSGFLAYSQTVSETICLFLHRAALMPFTIKAGMGTNAYARARCEVC